MNNPITLRGQNFRIITVQRGGEEDTGKVIAKATECTINLTTNLTDITTKDNPNLSSAQAVASKRWNVSVNSLSVLDANAMLTSIKNGTPFLLLWDETSTTDNQSWDGANFGRYGYAFINDLTLTFNDREISSKGVQFQGNGPINVNDLGLTTEFVTVDNAYTYGQFVRLFISNAQNPANVIGAAKQLSFHVSAQVEAITTKDTEGTWEYYEITALQYDITTSAYVASYEHITSGTGAESLDTFESAFSNDTMLYWQIANVSGTNNRTKGSVIASGRCYATSISVQSNNRQIVTFNVTMTGVGDFTVGL